MRLTWILLSCLSRSTGYNNHLFLIIKPLNISLSLGVAVSLTRGYVDRTDSPSRVAKRSYYWSLVITSARTMKFDDIFKEIGEFGPYQRRNYVVLVFGWIFTGPIMVLSVFVMGNPDHRSERLATPLFLVTCMFVLRCCFSLAFFTL